MRFSTMASSSSTAATKQDAQGLKLEVMEQRTRIIGLERSVEHLGKGFNEMDGKLDTVVNALTTLTTEQKLAKPLDWLKVTQLAIYSIGIFTAAVSGITYVVNALNAADKVAMRKDVDFLQMRVDRGWHDGGKMVIRTPKGEVKPE